MAVLNLKVYAYLIYEFSMYPMYCSSKCFSDGKKFLLLTQKAKISTQEKQDFFIGNLLASKNLTLPNKRKSAMIK